VTPAHEAWPTPGRGPAKWRCQQRGGAHGGADDATGRLRVVGRRSRVPVAEHGREAGDSAELGVGGLLRGGGGPLHCRRRGGGG
jgi:hypothetical protein